MRQIIALIFTYVLFLVSALTGIFTVIEIARREPRLFLVAAGSVGFAVTSLMAHFELRK